MYTDALKVLLRFIYFTQTRLGKRHNSNHGWRPDGIYHDITNRTDSSIIFICAMVSIFLLNLRVSFTENSYTFGTWLRCGPWGLHPLLHFYGNLWILLTLLPISSCNCRSLIGHSFIHSQFLTYLFWTKQDFIWSLFISMILVSLPTKQPLNHNLCLRSREWPFQEAWMENPL